MKPLTLTILALVSLLIPHHTPPMREGGAIPPPIPHQIYPKLAKSKFKPIKPVPVPQPVVTQVVAPAKPSVRIVAGCGDNSYAQFIYAHESSCNLYARNAGGCLGIGQACPGSKLTAVCDLSNYACQNRFFTAYANGRYGGWAGAYYAWLRQGWW